MKKFIFIIFLEALFFGGYAQGTPVYVANPWEQNGNAGTTDANFLGTTDNQSLIFRTNNVERMRISSDGKVGIGIDNPMEKLHIEDGSLLISRTINNNPYQSNNLFSIRVGEEHLGFSTWLLNHIISEGESGLLLSIPPSPSPIMPPPINQLFLSRNGSIGVGNTEPQAKLDISGDIRAMDATFSGTTTVGGLNTHNVNISGNTNIRGNIGIGTDVPKQKLHIVNGNILLTKSDYKSVPPALTASLLFGAENVDNFPMGKWGIMYDDGDYDNPGLHFWMPDYSGNSNIAYTLFLHDSGNVGIGTNNPQAQLDVNGSLCAQSATINGIVTINGTVNAKNANFDGSIKTKEINVTLDGWPDFVFDKDYELMPLSEVEQFITGNKHLPSVPSEAEVVANGVNVGEMNAILLQKVEELTLCIIGLQKQIDELKK